MTPRPPRPSFLPRWSVLLVIAVAFCAAAMGVISHHVQRSPGELLRYAERRLIGHPKLEVVGKPLVAWLRVQIEHPIDDVPVPHKQGNQSASLPLQRYGEDGRPVASVLGESTVAPVAPRTTQLVSPRDDLRPLLVAARPGDTFELLPGHYGLPRSIHLNQGGTPSQPVTVRAAQPGSVVIESSASEGFVVESPYWIFENLVIKGICPIHSNCEHAFHVVGNAQNTVIRNNRIEDFNAHIKVNGLAPYWPDHGLIQFNTLINTTPRDTARSVTPIDIVGASHWHVLDNQIRDFAKYDGNKISYGVFMKGGGQHGLIARNLIICTSHDISQPGQRIGASLGGGGTDVGSCRDRRCVTEHTEGSITHNVIAHCNDFGIYINKSNQSRIAHNKLINTYGIDVRYPTSSATLIENQLDGLVRARDGAVLLSTD